MGRNPQRSDVHKLFDAGYVTVTPDYQFEVSDHIHTDFGAGENYYELGGTKLWVPKREEYRPGREYLEWHNVNRSRGGGGNADHPRTMARVVALLRPQQLHTCWRTQVRLILMPK